MTLREIHELHAKVAAYITRHPELTLEQIKGKLHISRSMLSRITQKFNCARRGSLSRSNPELAAELDK